MKTLHFLYHELRPGGTPYTYVTPVHEFEQQVQFFASVNRTCGSAESTSLLPAITFDDGHRSDREQALPTLLAQGMHAHFFITVGWTGQRAAYMDWSQLRELHAAGQMVGAHGWSHQLLTHCTDAELNRELRDARAALEDGLGVPVTTMSLPGGRSDARVLRACTAAGYTQVFTSFPRAEEMTKQPATVGRLNVRGGNDLAWFQRMLSADERSLQTLARNEQRKAMLRRVLGDRLYARLWGVLNRQEREPDEAQSAGTVTP